MIDRRLALALSHFESFSFEELSLLGDTISPDIFFQLDKHNIAAIIGRPIMGNPLLGDDLARQVNREEQLLDQKGIGILSYWDKEYPPLLREIPDPPYILYYRGTLPIWDTPCVGIVGTRLPSEKGRMGAYKLGKDFSLQGIPVVSGLAFGIDTAAHKGVCDTGGRAVAVLASGLDSVYPKSNRGLAEKILTTGGCLLSQYPPGTPAQKHRFPKRNRIISGISRGSMVVEAPLRSGALITAQYALEQNRDVFVYAEGLHSNMGQGCQKLFEEGAPVVLSAEDLLSQWGILWDLQKETAREPAKVYAHPAQRWIEMLEAELNMGGQQ